MLLFKPDKMALEWRALDAAAHAAGATPQRVLALAGALAGPEDFFLRRFAFELFPRGTGFEAMPGLDEPAGLSNPIPLPSPSTTRRPPRLTTRSMARLDDGSLRVGVHIAAPAVFRARMRWRRCARTTLDRLLPRRKITMLPQDAVTAPRPPRAAASWPRPCTHPRSREPRGARPRIAPRVDPRGGQPAPGRPGPAPEPGRGRGRKGRRAARRRAVHSMEARAVAEGPARGRGREERPARLHLPSGRGPRVHRATPTWHAGGHVGLGAHDPRELDVGKASRRARLRCDVPKPGGRQDTHGGRAGLAPMARCVALRMDELTATPLQRPRQPAPARGDAARRGARLHEGRSRFGGARLRDRVRGRTASTSACSSATGPCGTSSRRVSPTRMHP